MAIWDIVTRPVRGVGRILRGKVKQGLGDIGSAAQSAAPLLALTGVGAPLAIGIGAAGGALERGARRGFNIENIARGGVTGGGRAAATQALKGVAGRLGGAPGAPATAGAPETMTRMGMELPTVATPLRTAAASPSFLQRVGQVGGDVVGLGDMDSMTKAYLLSQGLGAGAEIYGAHKMGEAEAERAELERRIYEDPLEARRAMAPLIAEYLKSRMRSTPDWRATA